MSLICCQRLKFTGIFGSNTLFVYTRKLTPRAGRRQKKILDTDSTHEIGEAEISRVKH
jgi:hypothetical protein